jgi:hypothetical protein
MNAASIPLAYSKISIFNAAGITENPRKRETCTSRSKFHADNAFPLNEKAVGLNSAAIVKKNEDAMDVLIQLFDSSQRVPRLKSANVI